MHSNGGITNGAFNRKKFRCPQRIAIDSNGAFGITNGAFNRKKFRCPLRIAGNRRFCGDAVAIK